MLSVKPHQDLLNKQLLLKRYSDGAVFCTGSIGYGQALPSNNFSNSASTVLKNVVDAFAKGGKLPGGKWTLEEKQWK